MSKSILQDKSFQFAVRIINVYKQLVSEQKEFVLSKQLLRSGTSVGANIREVQNAQSIKDVIHKLSISQKECDETMYWLELLNETAYLPQKEMESLHSDATELIKMLKSAIITSKNKKQG